MKTKCKFKKRDRERWRTNNKHRHGYYSDEVGEVVSIRSSPSSLPPVVWVQTKKGRPTGFCPDWLKLA